MKAPFPRFRIRELSHLQLQTTISRTVSAIKPIMAENATITLLVSSLEKGLTMHEKLLTRVIGSTTTAEIKAVGADRKTAISQFFAKVKLACKDLDSEIASVAKAVYAPIEKQGASKLLTKTHAEQHAGLNLIKHELSTPEMISQMVKLGVKKSFDQVIQLDNSFETLWHQRDIETASAESLPEMKENRRVVENSLRILLDIIEFHWTQNDLLISDIVHNSIRQMIVEMESTIGLRDTLDEKAKLAAKSNNSTSDDLETDSKVDKS